MEGFGQNAGTFGLRKTDKEFLMLAEGAGIGVMLLDASLRIKLVSPFMIKKTLINRDDLGALLVNTNFLPEYPNFIHDVVKCKTFNTSIEMEVSNGTDTGIVRISPINKFHSFDGIMVVLIDVSKPFSLMKNQMSALVNTIPLSVIQLKYDGRLEVTFANENFYDTIGMDKENFYWKHHNLFEEIMEPKYWEQLKLQFENMSRTTRVVRQEFQFNLPACEGRFYSLRMTVVQNFGGYMEFQAVMSDITAHKLKEADLQKKSEVDSMTGVYNHNAATVKISDKMLQREGNKKGFLIICDLDNFKKLNDSCGHMFGDAVLCFFSDQLVELFSDGIVGRIGGDEFVCYVEREDSYEIAKKLDLINERLAENFDDTSSGVHAGASFGVSYIDTERLPFETMFENADAALYYVKNNGKGNFKIERACNKEQDSTSVVKSKHYDENDGAAAIISSEEELVLYCFEIFENIPNTTYAIKLALTKVAKFYDLSAVAYVEHFDNSIQIINSFTKDSSKMKLDSLYNSEVYSWSNLVDIADSDGNIVLLPKTASKVIHGAKSGLIEISSAVQDYRATILFADGEKERKWNKERKILNKISTYIFAKLRNIRLEELEQKQVEIRLNYDSLTGLPVYNQFIGKCEKYFAHRGRKNTYIISSDFANFQFLNDTYGYETGDEILKRFACCIEEFNKTLVCCRVTGDVFVSLLSGESVTEVCNEYKELTISFAESINKEYNKGSFAISSGLYEVNDAVESVAYMVDRANDARKESRKQDSVTDVIIHGDELLEKMQIEKTITNNMLFALNNNEFNAYLQPKVSLKSGKIVGAEALVRWNRDDGELIEPSQFISMFEKNGFITKVDFAVLDQVIDYLAEAKKEGEEVVPVSVNFSRRHQDNSNFASELSDRIKKKKIAPELIETEITESVFMSDMDSLNSNIDKIHDRGMNVSIDDFGTGFSSLNMLSNVEADIVKLDKLFLKDISTEKSKTIIVHLIKMLKSLGFKVVVEGVETDEQLEILKAADCDMAQGYYYAKPMPITEFRKFLKEYNGEKAV